MRAARWRGAGDAPRAQRQFGGPLKCEKEYNVADAQIGASASHHIHLTQETPGVVPVTFRGGAKPCR
ncbi:hypothetical protein C0Z19_09070 [Trinickia soli]|uniref:Uncharacterized protein n=1 Tax=Trinickia soli TaxID=380675 RepID=A0A2N7W8I5_9BURK|nr:hypothetical protein CIW54_20770 [Paraburkholderia sp. T12-10]PMS25705.1 hypothetical protein C0Z19_09070 [Trinickia soli]